MLVDRKEIILLLLLSVIGYCIYSNSIQSPFVFDDEPSISKNHAIQITSLSIADIKKVATDSPIKTRPIAYISFAINYLFHGYNLFGYHAVNIIIHIITAILLYYFVLKTLTFLKNKQEITNQNVLIASLSSVLWFVHPVQVQSVAYIVQRMNSMASMFYLISIILFINARTLSSRPKSWALFAGVVIAWFLAIGSKEIAVTLPLFLYLYDIFFLRHTPGSWKRHLIVWLLFLFLMIAGVFLFLGSNPLEYLRQGYATRSFTLGQRLLTESRVIFFYLSLLVFPYPLRLNLQHDFSISTSLFSPPTTLFSVVGLAALLLIACLLFQQHRLASFSIFWFLGNLALESTIFPLELVFEHRLYLPSMAFSWLVAHFFVAVIPWKKTGIASMLIICLLFAGWSWQRDKVWASPLALAQDSVLKSPNIARAHGSYGDALYRVGDLAAATREFKKALQINPHYPEALNGLGLTLAAQGLSQQAEHAYQKALEINPNYMRAYNNLAALYLDTRKPQLAILHLRRAVQLRPDYIQAWYNLGLAYEAINRWDKAINCYTKALQFGPIARVNFRLGALYLNRKQCALAKKEFETAQHMMPGNHTMTHYLDLANECLAAKN